MRGRTALALALLVVAVAPAAAQGSADPKVTVGAGDAMAPANWEVKVPVTLTVAEGASVSRVTFRLEYPSKVLDFQRTEPADALQAAGIELEAQPARPPSDPATLQIEVAANAKLKALPSGMLGSLVFKISDDAEAGDSAVKTTQVKAWGPSATATLVAAAGPDGKLTVAPPGLPIFACFYYMH